MGWVSLCLEIHQQIIDPRLTQDVDEPGRHRGDLRGKGFFDIVSRYNHSLLGARIISGLDMISFDMHRLPHDHFSICEHVSRVAIFGVNDFRGGQNRLENGATVKSSSHAGEIGANRSSFIADPVALEAGGQRECPSIRFERRPGISRGKSTVSSSSSQRCTIRQLVFCSTLLHNSLW